MNSRPYAPITPHSGPSSPSSMLFSNDPYEVELRSLYNESAETGCSLLSELSVSDLKNLLESPERLTKFIQDHQVVAPFDAKTQSTREAVLKQAEENLALEPQLEALRQQVDQQCSELAERKQRYDELNRRYQQLCDLFNPRAISDGLIKSVAAVDEESERLAESFLGGRKELDEFLEEYVQRRAKSHSQKVRYEKLSGQLHKLQMAGF